MLLPLVLGAVMSQGNPTFTELTVYNQGFGFVKEVRDLNLTAGKQRVAIEDVAAMIDPTSVGIRSLTDANSFEVYEQNYQYDLISPIAILNKSVGKRVKLIRTIAQQRDVLEGTLISSPTAVVGADGGSQTTYNGMVIRTDDGRIILDPTGEVEVQQVPEGLISRPTLLWDILSEKAGANSVELSYITQGMNWEATYVLTLDGMDKHADLKGWVTLTNNSGATFKEARLKLLAGDVHQVQPPTRTLAFGGAMMKAARDENAFQEQGLFEYHLYTLQRPATVANHEIKQLSLLEGTGVEVKKKMILDSMRNFGTYNPGEGEIGVGEIKPQVRIEFQNSKANQLGIALPKGKVRIYKRDNSGSVQMLGEDAINHTPRDEKVSLVVGQAFDVVGARKRTNFTRLSPNSVEESFEIEVRNHKDTPESVYVLERHWGDWNVTQKSMAFTKEDSNTMQFVVDLKANETRKINYTVQTKW